MVSGTVLCGGAVVLLSTAVLLYLRVARATAHNEDIKGPEDLHSAPNPSLTAPAAVPAAAPAATPVATLEDEPAWSAPNGLLYNHSSDEEESNSMTPVRERRKRLSREKAERVRRRPCRQSDHDVFPVDGLPDTE